MKNKILILSLLGAALLSAHATAAPIYTYEEQIPISESITLTKVDAFYKDHDITYSYIKADLTDENTSLRLLKSRDGVDVLDTVGNLAATEENIVAAINADFFSTYKGGKGFSLGIEKKEDAMLASPIQPNTMATISYFEDTVAMHYLDFHVMVVAPNWQYNEIRHINKHTEYYGDILMYTSEWNGGMSPAPGGEVLEVVVSDGKIIEFRRNMPPVLIPEDGCVLVVSEGVNMFFANNFAVGDEIRFDTYLTPDIGKAEIAFGGGAMLISEGKIPDTFSHVISGDNPRSAIGTDEAGTTLYLLAVDGRQTSSRGMRMREMAELMQSLGCYNAVNLDGGGSTNMVASTVWEKALHKVHSPTENRKVINAVGLSYAAEESAPKGILLESDKAAVFVGEPVRISSALYDENMRPAGGEITLSSEFGKIEGGVFTPQEGGKAIVEAKSGEIQNSIEIFVVEKVAGIDTLAQLRLQKGESETLSISVFDSEGHYVPVSNIAPFSITSSNPRVASVSGQTVTGKESGTAVITIEKDGVRSFVSVAVGSEEELYTDRFSTATGQFFASTEEVTGTFGVTEEQCHSAPSAGKLSFDFGEARDAHAGMALARSGILSGETEITLLFYTEEEFGHTLMLGLLDKNGKEVAVPFTGSFQKGAWQTVTAKPPKNAAYPVTIKSVYVAHAGEQTSGAVFLDDLSYTESYAVPFATVPKETSAAFSADFSVGALCAEETMLASLVNAKTRQYAEKTGGIVLGEEGLKTWEDANALYVTLDTSDGGIRKTDAAQWEKLDKAIGETKKETVFLLANASIFGNSERENGVLRDYLASLDKEVFVISGGTEEKYQNIGGVQYFTVGNARGEKPSAAYVKNCRALAFQFGAETTFSWVSLY